MCKHEQPGSYHSCFTQTHTKQNTELKINDFSQIYQGIEAIGQTTTLKSGETGELNAENNSQDSLK